MSDGDRADDACIQVAVFGDLYALVNARFQTICDQIVFFFNNLSSSQMMNLKSIVWQVFDDDYDGMANKDKILIFFLVRLVLKYQKEERSGFYIQRRGETLYNRACDFTEPYRAIDPTEGRPVERKSDAIQ